MVVIILMWPYISVKLIKFYFLHRKVYCIFDTNNILLILEVNYAMQLFWRNTYFCVQLSVSVPNLAFLYAIVYQIFLWNGFVHLLYSMNLEFIFYSPQGFYLISCSFNILFEVFNFIVWIHDLHQLWYLTACQDKYND